MCGKSLLWYGTAVAQPDPVLLLLCHDPAVSVWSEVQIVGAFPSFLDMGLKIVGQVYSEWVRYQWSDFRKSDGFSMCCLGSCADWKLLRYLWRFHPLSPFLRRMSLQLHALLYIWAGFCSSNYSFKGQILIASLWLRQSKLSSAINALYHKSLSSPKTNNLSAYFFLYWKSPEYWCQVDNLQDEVFNLMSEQEAVEVHATWAVSPRDTLPLKIFPLKERVENNQTSLYPCRVMFLKVYPICLIYK